MGNCGGICAINISKIKGDIIMDKLLLEEKNQKDNNDYNINKIIY